MILYHRKSAPTGSIIAESLQVVHGESAADLSVADSPTLIRWGSRKDTWLDEEVETVVNSSESIENASNKLLSLFLMSENEVNVPKWNEDPFELLEEVGWPILGRKTRHARGSDIKLCLQERDLRNQMDYYVQYIPTVREYRVHVVRDEVIRIQGKYLDDPSMANGYIRNFATGYRFRRPRLRLKQQRLDMAVNAVKSLGLDFGAVDLIIGDDNETYILEVNTAPSCSPLTATEYVMAFSNILGLEEVDLSRLNLLNPNYDDEGDSEDEYEDE